MIHIKLTDECRVFYGNTVTVVRYVCKELINLSVKSRFYRWKPWQCEWQCFANNFSYLWHFFKKLIKIFWSMNLFCWVNLSIGIQFTFKMKFYRRNVCFQHIIDYTKYTKVYYYRYIDLHYSAVNLRTTLTEFRIITDS
jgi:hypothetical protein